jgi:hypothetical protein
MTSHGWWGVACHLKSSFICLKGTRNDRVPRAGYVAEHYESGKERATERHGEDREEVKEYVREREREQQRYKEIKRVRQRE